MRLLVETLEVECVMQFLFAFAANEEVMLLSLHLQITSCMVALCNFNCSIHCVKQTYHHSKRRTE